MSNNQTASRSRKRGEKSSRFRDVLLLSALALLLIFAVWKIFYTDDKQEVSTMANASESEQKLCALLASFRYDSSLELWRADLAGEKRVILSLA